MTDTTDVNRRSVLKGAVALGATASIAGCSALPFGGDGGGGGDLSYGDEVEGELGDGDDETSPIREVTADSYEFSGSAGDRVEISMVSEPLDPYLTLTMDGDLVAENDDADAMGLNSRIQTELSDDGAYTIWASRYDGFFASETGQEEGSYTLTLEEA